MPQQREALSLVGSVLVYRQRKPVAKRAIEAQRGLHREVVFVASKGKPRKPIRFINNTAWQNARKKADLLQVHVHDLKHTFGRRLRMAGVPLETRKVLLGHKTGDITSHYSAPELAELIRAEWRCSRRRNRRCCEL